MTYQLSAEDRALVEHVTAAAACAGPEAVASAIAIHARLLACDLDDERRLVGLLDARRRAIALREEALRLLRGEP